jgi:predicted dehydrogenase
MMMSTDAFSRRSLLAGAASLAATGAQAAPLQIGVIGLGSRSRAHFAAFRGLPEARVAALCDVDSARMAQANQALPAKAATYTDYRELIADRNVSVVVIAAPNYLHREMAVAALRAGKHVLLEKPIGINYAEAVEVKREAARSGRVLGIGMQRRYSREDALIQQTVDSGALGPVRLISCTEFRGDWNPRSWQYTDPATGKKTNWRFLKKTVGSSELEFSVHFFAQVCSLLKAPLTRLAASGGATVYRDRETRDVSAAVVDFANGARLAYSFTHIASAGGNELTIVGEQGVLRRQRGELQLHTRGGQWRAPQPTAPLPDKDATALMYEEFFRCVRQGKPSPLGAELAIEAAKIAYGIDISLAENRVVTARDFA